MTDTDKVLEFIGALHRDLDTREAALREIRGTEHLSDGTYSARLLEIENFRSTIRRLTPRRGPLAVIQRVLDDGSSLHPAYTAKRIHEALQDEGYAV